MSQTPPEYPGPEPTGPYGGMSYPPQQPTWQPQPPSHQPGGPTGGYIPPKQNQVALWSMILGIVAVVCCSVFTGIPALIMGIVSWRQIKESRGAQTGEGMAIAGIVLGVLSVVLIIAMVALLVIDYQLNPESWDSY